MKGNQNTEKFEERRQERRTPIYISQAILMRIMGHWGYIIDLNAKGLGVIFPKDTKLTSGAYPLAVFRENIQVTNTNLVAEVKKQSLVVFNDREYSRYSAIFDRKANTNFNFGMLYISEFFAPSIIFPHPLFFGEKIYGRVTGLAVDRLSVETSLRNFRFLIPGLKIEGTISFASSEFSKFVCHIKDIEILNMNKMKVDLTIQFIQPNFHNLVSNLAIFSGASTTQDLKNFGFNTGRISSSFSFEHISNHSISSILDVRLSAQNHIGRFVGAEPKEMKDRFDDFSKHFVLKSGSDIAATGRIIFNDGEPSKSEVVSCGAVIPPFIWQGGFVEISRVATEHKFRGGDLFLKVVQRASMIAFESKVRYLVLSCEDNLLRPYLNTGVSKAGDYINEGQTWHLLYLDMEQKLLGIKINPFVWNILFNDVYDFYEVRLNKTMGSRIRIKVLKLLKNMSDYLLEKKISNKKK